MLRGNDQMRISLSPYSGIYDAVVPEDHILRKIKENIDFSFVNPMLKKQYCEEFGRPAKEPEMMFKLMFLKKIWDLSDARLVSQAQTDMAVKYFLNLDPEAEMIDSSLMTKFRKTRITEDILEEMLKEIVRQAIEKGIIKSKTIIVDATHTLANARMARPTQILRDLSRKLRRQIYQEMYDLSSKFPEKPSEAAELEEEIDYTQQLLAAVGKEIETSDNQGLQHLIAQIKALLEDEEIRKIRSTHDQDARFGHKSTTNTFFGYKNHIAMTAERIITGIEVTDGGEQDVKYLTALSERTRNNGVEVNEIVGDMAYVSEENLAYCGELGITLIAKTNAMVAALEEPKNDGFAYNKDAGTMQCPAGELAYRHRKKDLKSGNVFHSYLFSKMKCRKCPLANTCPAVHKSENAYSFTILNDKNRARLEFEKTDAFLERLKIRPIIEEKNGEMKVAHGLRTADSTGLAAMRLQMYFTAFVVNAKRIVTLLGRNAPLSLPHCRFCSVYS